MPINRKDTIRFSVVVIVRRIIGMLGSYHHHHHLFLILVRLVGLASGLTATLKLIPIFYFLAAFPHSSLFLLFRWTQPSFHSHLSERDIVSVTNPDIFPTITRCLPSVIAVLQSTWDG